MKDIAISGSAGTGTTTLTKTIIKTKPDLVYVNGGGIMREFAKDAGFEKVSDYLLFLEQTGNRDVDHVIDKRFIGCAGDVSKSYLLEGRFVVPLLSTIIAIQNNVFKVALWASENVSAQRVADREGLDVTVAMAENAFRNEQDLQRGKNLYGINIADYQSYADLVLCSDEHSPEELADQVMLEYNKRFEVATK